MRKFIPFLFLTILTVFVLGLTISTGEKVAQSQNPINPDAQTGLYDEQNTAAVFYGKEFTTQTYSEHTPPPILGVTSAPKRIEVDLAVQRLYAYEGDTKVFDFLISSGKWGRTPTGTFKIWSKFKYTKMSGGSKELGTYYYLPNVPYTMFFSNDQIAASRGFGIHGTYWHDNFGHPMSHGCINMKTEEAELLFYWADPVLDEKNSIRATEENPGTEVIIYGIAPKN